MRLQHLSIALSAASALLLTACGQGSSSYSILSASNSFQQAAQPVNNKIDVLWVIDNSGSMASSQQNLANNFPSFINGFKQKNFDFQIAVTTTDAFLSESPLWDQFYNDFPDFYDGEAMNIHSEFRDGYGSDHSGVRVITPDTANLNDVFFTNVMQGINGYGDERAIESFRAALQNPLNSGFVRDGGYLAVILVTDEDDFSYNGTDYLEYLENEPGFPDSPELTPLSDYTDFLDQITGSNGATRRYSVNTIAINDQACLNKIGGNSQKIGKRVEELADLTGGTKADICGDFADQLKLLSDNIIKLSTQFYLQRLPVEDTIKVSVNGQSIPEASKNPDGNGGWAYNAEANSVVFSGDYVPPQGAVINVTFDPQSLNF